MENPFEFHEEDTIIACVGDNGGTTDEDIRNGFKRTVELLTESLKTGSEVEDLLVYPIVYNARHSIELSLKIVIKMLWRIEEKKGICYSEEVLKERKKELHTHSIECLYKLACDKKNIDRRIPAYFENIEDMIYFYYFDEEGDAFKYELNKEDEPHMIKNKISHVSMVEASNPVPTPLLGHRCRSSQEITGSPTPFSTSNHYLWIWLSASFNLSNPNIAA